MVFKQEILAVDGSAGRVDGGRMGMLTGRYSAAVSILNVYALVMLFLMANQAFSASDSLREPLHAPQFSFQSTTKGALDQKTYRGNVQLVFFGFMNCPDVCPLTLSNVARVLKRMGDTSGDVSVLFVSVDRRRDTLEKLKDYVSYFDPGFIGVTGSADEIRAAAAAFQAPYSVRQSQGGDIQVVHSGFLYVVNRDGSLRGKIPHNAPLDQVESELNAALLQHKNFSRNP